MLICEDCQQGFHLECFGLATIPEEDQWVCAGCQQLQALTVGQHIVLEMAQTLYQEGPDPHLSQGLFQATIQSFSSIQPGMWR